MDQFAASFIRDDSLAAGQSNGPSWYGPQLLALIHRLSIASGRPRPLWLVWSGCAAPTEGKHPGLAQDYDFVVEGWPPEDHSALLR